MHSRTVSRPRSEWCVAPTTNTDTLMANFNNPVMDPDTYSFNTSQNIVAYKEPKFYRQAISEPNADLQTSTIEAEIHYLRLHHTWDVVVDLLKYNCGF
jgi:hypothetical protein